MDETTLEGMDADELRELVKKLLKRIDDLEDEVERLRDELDREQRSNKRTTAPFRRNQESTADDDSGGDEEDGTPGRDAGHEGSYRQPPSADDIDQTIEEPLDECPHCDGPVGDPEDVEQFIIELPEIKPVITRLITQKAHCNRCGTVWSSHPLQTSRATGAAQTQFGPRCKALAVDLHKRRGLSLNKTAEVLEEVFGIDITPGAIVHAEHKLAEECAPDYAEILKNLRESDVVHADETSWWVAWQGGQRWLWSWSSRHWSLFRIAQSRGSDIVEQVLGDAFEGTLVSDCLSAYDAIECDKQKCYAHHLRALSDYEKQYPDSKIIPELKAILRQAIQLDEQWDSLQPDVREDRLRVLEARMATYLLESREPEHSIDQKAVNRLRKQQAHLFEFVGRPEVDATNNQAEREIRPAVITRKISSGNKTERGALTWQILKSVQRTRERQGKAFRPYLADKLRVSGTPPPN